MILVDNPARLATAAAAEKLFVLRDSIGIDEYHPLRADGLLCFQSEIMSVQR